MLRILTSVGTILSHNSRNVRSDVVLSFLVLGFVPCHYYHFFFLCFSIPIDTSMPSSASLARPSPVPRSPHCCPCPPVSLAFLSAQPLPPQPGAGCSSESLDPCSDQKLVNLTYQVKEHTLAFASPYRTFAFIKSLRLLFLSLIFFGLFYIFFFLL